MVANLYRRAQDPDDKGVDASFVWPTFDKVPARCKYNMDEMGSDTNKGRKKIIAGVDAMLDALKHAYDETDGDNNPFHVTNCMTTRADGATVIPPMLIHSNPSTQSKSNRPKLMMKYLMGVYTEGADGSLENPTKIRVAVSKSGSMTKELFPSFCRHFVDHLPEGQGKGGEPVILIFDGHASRWSYEGLKLLLDNNVYCLCLPGHTSVWAQPNDGGPNASYKSCLGDHIKEWRDSRRALPGNEAIMKMDRADFNAIFVAAWLSWTERQRLERKAGSNSIITAWAGTGLEPYCRAPAPYWQAAISKFGKREALATPPASGGAESNVRTPPLPPAVPTNGPSLADVFAKGRALLRAPATGTADAAGTTDPPAANASMAIVPVTTSVQSVMAMAVTDAKESKRVRTFETRLGAMKAGENVTLQPAGGGSTATLIARDKGYMLVHTDGTQPPETLTLQEANEKLAKRYLLPVASTAELSEPEARAVRRREVRQAAATRKEMQDAAVDAAIDQWYHEQFELAWELGIEFHDWQRIVTLLTKNVQRSGKYILLNSVAAGRTVVIDAAVEEAVAAAAPAGICQGSQGARGREG